MPYRVHPDPTLEKGLEIYRDVNKRFSDTVLAEVGDSPAIVFIQDYHLALLPRYLRNARPDLKLIHIWHIPWTNCEAFRIFPWSEEILDGLLGNDLLGFHIQYHCNNFLGTVDKAMEAMVDYENFSMYRGGRPTYIRPFPVSSFRMSSARSSITSIFAASVRFDCSAASWSVSRACSAGRSTVKNQNAPAPIRMPASNPMMNPFMGSRLSFSCCSFGSGSITEYGRDGSLFAECRGVEEMHRTPVQESCVVLLLFLPSHARPGR